MKLLNMAEDGLLQANFVQCRPSMMRLCGCRSQQETLFEDYAMSVQKKEKISLKQRQSKLNRKHSIPQTIEHQHLTSPKTLKNIENGSYFDHQPTFSLKRIQENTGERLTNPFEKAYVPFTNAIQPYNKGKDSQTNSLPSIPESNNSNKCRLQAQKSQLGSGESNSGRTCTQSHQGVQQKFSAPYKLQRGQSLMDSLSLYSSLSPQRSSQNAPNPQLNSCKRSASPTLRPKVCRSIIFGENDKDQNQSVFSEVLSDDDFNNVYFKTSFKRSSEALH